MKNTHTRNKQEYSFQILCPIVCFNYTGGDWQGFRRPPYRDPLAAASAAVTSSSARRCRLVNPNRLSCSYSTPTTKAARTGHAMRLGAYWLQSPVDRLGRAGSCAFRVFLMLTALHSGSPGCSSVCEAVTASCLTRCPCGFCCVAAMCSLSISGHSCQ